MDPMSSDTFNGDAPLEPDPPRDPPPPPPPHELVLDDGRTVQDVQRENVFLKANVDLDSKVGKLMLKSWDGPLTLEAITAEATELGCLRVARDDQTPPSPEATERSEFAHGAEPSTTLPQKHPHDIAKELGTQKLMAGETTEDAIRAGFGVLVEGALKGDPRVLVQPPPPNGV